MGIVSRGATCGVAGCGNDGVRSLNTKRVEAGGLEVASAGKKTVLCREHYKEWKRETREDRALERARYDRF